MKVVNRKNSLSVKKLFRRYLIIPLLSLAFLLTVVTHAVAENGKPNSDPLVCTKEVVTSQTPSSTPKLTTFKNATIELINAEQTGLRIQQCNPDPLKPYPVNFSVNSVEHPELKGILEGFSSGDLVNLVYTNNDELKSLSVVRSPVSVLTRLVTILFIVFVLVLLTGVILGLAKSNFWAIQELFVGKDKRLSNSKSQMAVWFFVLIVSYISLSWLRSQYGDLGFVGGIGIPQNLLFLSGVSALTYAGAKVITQSQVNSKPDSKPEPIDGKSSLANFVTDDQGSTDFGDFQMTVITLLALVVYCVQVFNFLGTLQLYKSVTLPDVDTTILSIFGLSQGAYLAKKAVVATGAKEEVLKLGMKGEEVKKLKVILTAKTKPPLSVNDNFDQSTEDAVRKFQQDNQITGEDGFVGSKTREKLQP